MYGPDCWEFWRNDDDRVRIYRVPPNNEHVSNIRGGGPKLNIIALLGSIDPVHLKPFLVVSPDVRLFRGEDMAVEWDNENMDAEAFKAFCSF